MIAILKKELKNYYTSLITYVYYVLFFLAIGIYFSVYCIAKYNTQFGYYVLSKSYPICMIIIPFFTMRMFAQEKRRKTDQLLFTAPVSGTEILLGKYFALIISIFTPIILSIIYPIVLSNYGEVCVRFVVCAYIGLCLLVLAAISLGTYFSTITSNMFLAAILTYGVYALFILLRVIEYISGDGMVYKILHTISPYNIYNDMASGIVRSGDICFMIFIGLLFLLLSWFNVNKRYLKKQNVYIGIITSLFLFIAASVFSFNNSVVYDFTPEKILTLSEETKEIVSQIGDNTDIYYMGEISSANATYKEFLNLYKNINDNINIHYKRIDNDLDFQIKYMKDISMINEASLLVVSGESYIYLDSDDYISTVQLSDYSYKSLLDIEAQLTSAVYHVNHSNNYKIYCAEGHGEESVSGKIYNYITINGYDIKSININEKMSSLESTIPDDCSILLINAPQIDYSKEEIDILKKYVDDGGRLAIILDPLNEEINNLYSYFEEYGMSIASGIVIEKDPTRYAYDTAYSLAPRLKDHEITKELIDQNLYVYTMTSKGILASDAVENRTDLMMTSAKAFSKISDFDNITTKNDGDIGGPFSIASIYEKNNGKVFLITSNLFMDNDTDKDTLGGNHRFLINALDYLSEREDSIHIMGKDVNFNTALFHNSKIKLFQSIVIFVIPFLVLLLGGFIIIIRVNNILINHHNKKENSDSDK